MPHEKRMFYGLSNEQVAQQLERESPEFKARQERETVEVETSRWARFVRKVRAEQQQRAEQLKLEDEAIRAMTPAEYDAFKRRVPVAVEHAPRFPPRYGIALGDIATEDAKARNREREQRERDLGLPEAQRAWAEAERAIRDTRAAVREQCRGLERAAQEAQREALEQLGGCPTLESMEAVTAA